MVKDQPHETLRSIMKTILAFLFLAFGALAQSPFEVSLVVSYPSPPSGMTYNVYRVDGACPTTLPTWGTPLANIAATTYVDRAVSPAHTYCYMVRAVWPLVGESGDSNVLQATTPPYPIPVPIITGTVSLAPVTTTPTGAVSQ